MLHGRSSTFAAALVGIAALFFGGSRADAAIRLEFLTPPNGTGADQVFYATASGLAVALVDIGGYHVQVDTTLTNFAGTATQGAISTTLNISSIDPGSDALLVKVDVIDQVKKLDDTPNGGHLAVLQPTDPNRALVLAAGLATWTLPSGNPVMVTANTSTSSVVNWTSGTAITTTFFNAAPVVASGVLVLTSPADQLATTVTPSTGTYTLGQTILLTGATSVGVVNVTGTSTVNAVVPEPSAMALAGLGALGFIGFGLRRRKAAGA
jgi:hypothetical protein